MMGSDYDLTSLITDVLAGVLGWLVGTLMDIAGFATHWCMIGLVGSSVIYRFLTALLEDLWF